jgi:hypothetical protein
MAGVLLIVSHHGNAESPKATLRTGKKKGEGGSNGEATARVGYQELIATVRGQKEESALFANGAGAVRLLWDQQAGEDKHGATEQQQQQKKR